MKRLFRLPLLVLGIAMFATLVAACSAEAEIVEVVKEVPVEVIKTETVVVEKEVPVEVKVVETVIKEVAVERVVVATPTAGDAGSTALGSEGDVKEAGFLLEAPESNLKRGGHVRTAWGVTTKNYDLTQGGNTNALSQGYNNLVRYDPTHGLKRLVPELASDWSISDDLMNYNFTLREDAVYSDGTPFTAHDVVATFERVVNPPEGISSNFKSVYEVMNKFEAVSDYEVNLGLSEPRAWVFSWIPGPEMGIYSKKSLEANNYDMRKSYAPGTGPWVLDGYTTAEKWEWSPSPTHFYPHLPYVDKLTMIHVPNPVERGTAVLTKQADFSWNVAPETYLEGEKRDNINNYRAPSFGGQILHINNTKAPFDNADFRRAMRLAVNRHDAVKAGIAGGWFYEVGHWIHPRGEHALTAAEMEQTPGMRTDNTQDLATARDILADLGYSGGKGLPEFDLGTPTSAVFVQAWAPFVQDQLSKLGIKTKIRTYERAMEGEEIKKDYDLIMGSISGRPPTPDHTSLWLNNWYTGADYNYSRYSNSDFDKVVDGLNATMDPVEKYKLFRAGEAILDKDSPNVPVGWIVHHLMWNDYVKGLSLEQRAQAQWGRIDTVWLDQ